MPSVRILTGLAIAAYALAALTYGFHAVATNPQYDNQGIFYAKDLLESGMRGTLAESLLVERKYPMAYVLPFALIDTSVLLATDAVTKPQLFLIGRLVTLAFALGTFVTLWCLGRRLGSGTAAVLLLMTSVLFLLFSSAIRPHVPVTFWTLLTLLAAIREREHPHPRRAFLAFAAAGVAFATLQSGLLAFVFPMWAVTRRERPLPSLLRAGAWALLTLLPATILGYPFLLRPLMGLPAVGGVDLGHDVGLHFHLLTLFSWLPSLLGGQIILIVLAGMGLFAMRRARAFTPAWMAPVSIYIILFVLVFGFHTSAAGRFFLPILPLLALLGTPVFLRLQPHVRTLMLVLILLVGAKMTWLALESNTYDQISTFAATQTGKVGTIAIPAYFFTLADEKIVTEADKMEDIGTIVIPDSRPDMQAKMKGRVPCFHAVASRTTDEIVLLWNDTPWALWHVFEALRLGPNMTAYCLARS